MNMDTCAAEASNICHVVALPWPGRGHINPMLNVCRFLAAKRHDILITFVITEEWSTLLVAEPKPDNIRISTIPNVLMSERTRSGKFPAFYEEVMTKMEAPVDELFNHLQPTVTTIIADTFLTWALGIANRRKIPMGSLWTMSTPVYAVMRHFELLIQKGHYPVDLKERGEEVVDYVPGISPTRIADLAFCFDWGGRELLHKVLPAMTHLLKAQFLLFCSIYELEAQTIDALKRITPLPIYHIGPTIPYLKLEESTAQSPSDDDAPDYFQWLDKQPKASVLYVSQGSHHSAADAQLEELAAGLRDSGIRYLWVARGETSKYKKTCGEKGFVVPWCDQLRVLCHSSVGGFWSHCGWSSASEAAFAGVPVLTFPLYWDQTQNSKLIVEDWKMGLRVKSGVDADKVVTREEIAGLVRKFMDAESEEGKELRRRAGEVHEICRRAIQKDGSSDANINALIDEISKYNCYKM